MIALGLRFDKRDGPLLRAWAERVKQGDTRTQQAANTFTQAAIAAETGEPLEVFCDEPSDIVKMAALYVAHGCRQPAVEELSGHAR